VLLVVEASGSVTVYDDSSVGDYDGGDDTLVGIWNNSSKAVDAVTVSGPGSHLAGFDGDGLCSFITCTWPTAAGYEGPRNTFTTSLAVPDSAEVDFTGGLPSGAITYFSLEGTLTEASLTARQGPLLGLNYVALGDSYSSGEGNAPYMSGTDVGGANPDRCHRSGSSAYPDLLAADAANGISTSTFPTPGFVACSGATRDDFWNGNIGNHEPSQLNAVSATTNVVTIGLGGDDVGFHRVLDACITASDGFIEFHGDAKCSAKSVTDPSSGDKMNLDAFERKLVADLGVDSLCQTPSGFVDCSPSLATIYEAIAAQAAPRVKIRVLLYPHLFSNTPANSGCRLFKAGDLEANISKANMTWINEGVDILDNEVTAQVQKAAATGIDIAAVDPRPDFNDDAESASPGGHGVCTKQPWIAGLLPGAPHALIDSGSFHPTATGQRAFANEIAPSIR
jgi:hypothetical protein